jgi:predicted GNAT superfamily acetyltransferase
MSVGIPATAPRDMGPADLAEVLRLNQAALPAVSSLDAADLAQLRDETALALVHADDVGVQAFALLFEETANYESLNFQWFRARYAGFLYMDRIVVAPDVAGSGLGRTLYRHAAPRAVARGVMICCEVNLEPPNPASMAFHQRLGFQVVGERGEPGSGKRVAMMVHPTPMELMST